MANNSSLIQFTMYLENIPSYKKILVLSNFRKISWREDSAKISIRRENYLPNMWTNLNLFALSLFSFNFTFDCWCMIQKHVKRLGFEKNVVFIALVLCLFIRLNLTFHERCNK